MGVKTTTRAPTLDGLIAEARTAQAELAALAHPKLTAAAFLAAAVKAAGSTPERIASLRRVIEAGADGRTMRTQAFVRRLAREFRTPGWPHAPKSAERLGPYGRDEAVAELETIGSHVLEAMAVAALVATTSWPESFGDVSDWDTHEAKRTRLTGRLAEIGALIRAEIERLRQQIGDLEATAAALGALGL